MDWLRIGLATVVMTAIPVLAVTFFHRRHTRREAATPDFQRRERVRAQTIVRQIGGIGIIYVIGWLAGLAAIVPIICLGGAIATPAVNFPKLEELPLWIASFIGGWIVFSWCNRITDALDD